MGFFNLFKPKCFSCKKRTGDLKYCEYYTGNGDYYHEECLKEILNKPEKFPNSVINKALIIAESILDNLEYRQNMIKKTKKYFESFL